MKTKIISLAVAAALVAPAAVMADATLYGRLHMSIDYVDIDKSAANNFGQRAGTPGPAGLNGWDINANERSNRLGVKGSEDLGNGLKAIYQFEFTIPAADGNGNIIDNREAITMRNTYVGLASNFGTVLVGRHDTPFKLASARLDQFADSLADYNYTVGFHDLRADNAIAYVSPSFSGFQLSAAVVPSGGATAGFGTNTNLDGINEGASVAGVYKNGPFYGSLAWEWLSAQHARTQGNTAAGVQNSREWEKWQVSLGLLDWNGFTLAGIYEHWDNAGFRRNAEADLWQIQAGYSFGNNKIKAMYGQADRSDIQPFGFVDGRGNPIRDADRETWAIGFDHNFSKRTGVYVLYTDVSESDLRDADWSGFSLGMTHSF